MLKYFLISFCNNKINIKNNGTGYIGILKINTKTKKTSFEELPIGLPNNIKGNGVTGMCHHNNQIVLLLQRMPSTLIFLDKNLDFVDYWQIDNVRGVHSILSKDNELYLSVTNQDKIIKVNSNKTIEEVWSKQTENDTIHLNSICIHNNSVHATAFGLKETELWSSARFGTLFEINSNKVIIENIWHPHSSFSFGGEVYCCDSSNQRVIGKDCELMKDLPGYTRGLYIDEDLILCGVSHGRLVSHSTGIKISNKSDKGELAGNCGITIHFKDNNFSSFLNFKGKAFEVFDILSVFSSIT